MKPIVYYFKKRKPLYLLMHIPKTGGTSLYYHAVQWFGNDKILSLISETPNDKNFNIDSFYDNKKLLEKNKDILTLVKKFDVVFGHFRYGLHHHFPDRDCKYITIIRNPIKQFLSAFYYFKLFKDEFQQPQNIIEAIHHKHSHANIQTFFISGVHTFNRLQENPELYLQTAINNIKTHFLFIGNTDTFNDSIDKLSVLLNKKVKTYFHQKKGTYNYENLTPNEIEIIRKTYYLDFKLFNYFFPENSK